MKKRTWKLGRLLGAGLATLVLAAFAAVLMLHRNGSIQTDIWIDAPPQAVWKVLTTTTDYAAWNPMITRIDGPLRVGSVIEFTNGSGSDAMTFHPTILAVRPSQELRWKGYVWRPGLFDGEHRFLLEANGNRTHFVQSENFTGLLAGRLSQDILRETASHMEKMNLALKIRAEALSASRACWKRTRNKHKLTQSLGVCPCLAHPTAPLPPRPTCLPPPKSLSCKAA